MFGLPWHAKIQGNSHPKWIPYLEGTLPFFLSEYMVSISGRISQLGFISSYFYVLFLIRYIIQLRISWGFLHITFCLSRNLGLLRVVFLCLLSGKLTKLWETNTIYIGKSSMIHDFQMFPELCSLAGSMSGKKKLTFGFFLDGKCSHKRACVDPMGLVQPWTPVNTTIKLKSIHQSTWFWFSFFWGFCGTWLPGESSKFNPGGFSSQERLAPDASRLGLHPLRRTEAEPSHAAGTALELSEAGEVLGD